jgi:ferredoxin-nitrite reductase
MPPTLNPPPKEFSREQKEFLEGFFSGKNFRGVAFRDVESTPKTAEEKKPDAELIFEERIKRELHPLDAYSLLTDHAELGKNPERENIYRFKWHGLFYLAPNADGFMARLRIPGGHLKSYQLREIAALAKDLASGFADITTRANLQVRVFKIKDAPEVLRRIQSVGLHTRGAGADNVRNLTASPTAGIDPHELIDVTPYLQQLAQFIFNHREFYNLPRKFNISLDGAGRISVLEDTNDIGFQAVQISEPPENHPLRGKISAGIYFRAKLAGVTGHQTFAQDAGVLIPSGDLVKMAAAILRVFIAHGNRSDRKKARLKYLLESWGLEKFLAAVEKEFGNPLLRAPLEDNSLLGAKRELPSSAFPQLGAHPQKQKGFYYVGVVIPVGRITSKQIIRLAELAELYGSGEVRLTVWQNLIIPNVSANYVETLKKALVKMGLHWQASNVRGGVVACTGNSYCKFASTNTKGHAIEIANYLEKKLALDQPVNIHLTGCPNSCAQHYIGDIGLLGTKVKVSGETVEGYHVFVGGGFGENRALGRQVFSGISFEQLKPTLETMLRGYLRHRQPDETFLAFTQRHDLNKLQLIFSNEE